MSMFDTDPNNSMNENTIFEFEIPSHLYFLNPIYQATVTTYYVFRIQRTTLQLYHRRFEYFRKYNQPEKLEIEKH